MSNSAKYVAFNLNVLWSATIAAPAAMPGGVTADLGRFEADVGVSDGRRLDIGLMMFT